MIPDLDLLGLLRDAHPPPEPSWWPPALGWWLAAALGVALAVFAIRRLPALWRRWRTRRRVLAALDAILARQRAGQPGHEVCAEVSALLRLAAVLKFPERNVGGLHGQAWLAFLESRDRMPGRFEPLREALTVAPYAPGSADVDPLPLVRAVRGWLRAVL